MNCCTPHKPREVINKGVYISSTQHQQQRECTLAGGTPKAKAKACNTSEKQSIMYLANIAHPTNNQEAPHQPRTHPPKLPLPLPQPTTDTPISMHTIYTRRTSTLAEMFMAKTGSPYSNYFTYFDFTKRP